MEAKDVTKIHMIRPFVQEALREANLEFDLIHGVRHCIDRVPNEAKFLCEINKIGWLIACSLDVAALAHDLGRVVPYGNHAEHSARIFLEMPLADLWPNTREAIAFAIRNHTHGLAGLGIKRAGNFKETLLGLLGVADHADHLGGEGAIRDFAAASTRESPIPLFSSQFSDMEILQMMKKGASVEHAKLFTKDSVVAGLAFQWQAACSIIEPVEHLLNETYHFYWNQKRRQTKTVIDLLLREQKEKYELERRVKNFILQLGSEDTEKKYQN